MNTSGPDTVEIFAPPTLFTVGTAVGIVGGSSLSGFVGGVLWCLGVLVHTIILREKYEVNT